MTRKKLEKGKCNLYILREDNNRHFGRDFIVQEEKKEFFALNYYEKWILYNNLKSQCHG